MATKTGENGALEERLIRVAERLDASTLRLENLVSDLKNVLDSDKPTTEESK